MSANASDTPPNTTDDSSSSIPVDSLAAIRAATEAGGDGVVEFANAMAHVEGTAVLYFSLWMRSPADAEPYRDLWPRRAPALELDKAVFDKPIPVSCDSASLTYLRSRHVEWLPEAYVSEASAGQTRVRIRGVRVARAPASEGAVDMSLEQFLRRYLAQRYIGVEQTSDEDVEQVD